MLNEQQQAERKRLLAQVHINAKGLGEADYRSMVAGHSKYGYESAGELRLTELRLLARALRPENRSQPAAAPGMITSKQLKFIRVLWSQKSRDKGDESLRRWVAKCWHIDRLEWLPRNLASQVIKALEKF